MTLRLSSATGLRLVATLSIAYALSHFLRASVGVIAPELQQELDLSPEALGLLSGLFFAFFAAVQIPVGIALDRVGPRAVLVMLSGVTVLGALIFALAEGLPGLALGRALMGVGCAAMLMAPYVIYARVFPEAQFAQVSSIQLGVGNIGVILATVPLAWAALAFGWRSVFLGAAVCAVVFAVATARVTRGLEPPRGRRSFAQDLRGVVEVTKIPGMMRLLPLVAVAYSSFASISTLWGGPYLADVHGLGPAPRGEVLLAMAVAGIVGLLGFGPLDRRFNTRKGVVLGGGALSVTALLGLALIPAPPLPLVILLFVMLGLGHGYIVALAAHTRVLLPDHLIGRGVTLSNMVNMFGVAALQILLGLVAGMSGAESELSSGTYRLLFAIVAGCVVAALALYATAEDRRPVNAEAANSA